MLFRRPLLFLSLPGLALVLGLVWYRRKKSIHFDISGDTDKKDIKTDNIKDINTKTIDNSKKIKHSSSLPIGRSKSAVTLENNNTRLGKSAPIDIIPNLRSPPINKTERISVDPEELTSKIKDSEYKTLRSIEEQEDFDLISPIDLPDSVEQKRFLYSPETRNIEIEEPVVIKATMPAKISPTNSFAESKYTDKCADDERDSANHSPIQEISDNDNNIKIDIEDKININTEIEENLTKQTRNPPVSSPPLSECSLHSNDSGKGSSPPHSIGGIPPITYEFLLPQSLVGQIIGRKGTYVNQIKTKTGASVLVKKLTESNKMKTCSIQGSQKEIDEALKMIRQKLPESRYPNLTMARVYLTPQTVISLPAIDSLCLRLQLIEGINNDVIVSAIMSGGHVFFQQPLHPSFPSLNILQSLISQSYSIEESPALPEIKEDAICVAPISGSWFRVQIVSYNPETQSCLVKYLDYGGYTTVLGTELRQIRKDFMSVSFQAMECLLSNIRPIGGATEWVPEAATVLEQLTKGIILQAQVAGYSTDGLPEVFLYACLAPDNVIFINQELVARGLAEWVEALQ